MTQKIYHNIFFNHYISLLKAHLKYLFNAVILFKTAFYLKLNFIQKIDPNTFNFENLEEISQKPLATL